MKRKTFEDCRRGKWILETKKNRKLASELIGLAKHKESFWQEIDMEEKYPSLYIEGNYEIIKELCTAILALEGWMAVNHECLFICLDEKRQDLELDFNYLLELKDTRNAIDYKGMKISFETWKQNKLKILIIIKTLKEEVSNRIKFHS